MQLRLCILMNENGGDVEKRLHRGAGGVKLGFASERGDDTPE